LLVVGSLSLTVYAETRPRYGRAVVGSLLSEPTTIDPISVSNHAEVSLAALVFDGLYRIDDEGKVVPHLAAAMPTSGGLVVRIPLRDGVAMHDGTKMRARDVVASLERLAKSDAGWLLASVSSISAENGELVLRMSRADRSLATHLAAPAAAITKRGKTPRIDRANGAIGSGAFTIRVDRKRRRVVLRAFDDHFAGRPYVNKVELRWYGRKDEEVRAYEAGRTHLSFRGEVAFAGHQPKYATDTVEGAATLLVYVGFGKAHPKVTNHHEFRRALSLAVGRSGFRNVGSGERVVPAIQPAAVDIGGPATSQGDRAPRLTEAKSALAIAARSIAALEDRNRITLEVLIDETRPDDREIAEKVVSALFKLGLAAKIKELPAEKFTKRVAKGDCDLFVGQLVSPVASPAAQIFAAFAAGGDTWARLELKKRPVSAARAIEAFHERLPVIPLFHRAVRVHHRINVRWRTAVFDSTSRLTYADLFVLGGAKPN